MTCLCLRRVVAQQTTVTGERNKAVATIHLSDSVQIVDTNIQHQTTVDGCAILQQLGTIGKLT